MQSAKSVLDARAEVIDQLRGILREARIALIMFGPKYHAPAYEELMDRIDDALQRRKI